MAMFFSRIRFSLRTALAVATLLGLAPFAHAATITAQLDQSPVPVNQSFQLTYSVQGSADGDPDFSPIQKDFQVLGRSQSTQMEIILSLIHI